MTSEEFAPLWAEMLAAWPAAKPVAGSASLYLRRLAEFTVGEVRTVLAELEVSSDFFPSIAAIWQRCLAIRDDAPGWEQAWAEAVDAAAHRTSVGPRERWAYSHDAVHEALDLIGVWEVAHGTNTAALRAQFRDAYQGIVERRRRAYAAGTRELPPPPARRLQLAPPSPS